MTNGMTRTGTRTNPYGSEEKDGGAGGRVQQELKQEVELQRVSLGRTGQLSKGSRFKTIMTSPGHERTGQTEKGAESLSSRPPSLPPSCRQLTQTRPSVFPGSQKPD